MKVVMIDIITNATHMADAPVGDDKKLVVLSGPDVKKSPYSDTPLYPEAQMSALVKYFSWFANNRGVTKEVLSSLLYLQHHSILPKNNLLPDSYEAGLK